MKTVLNTYSSKYFLYFAITLLFLFPAHSLFHFFNTLTIITRLLSCLLSFVILYRSLRLYSPRQLFFILLALILVTINTFLSGWYYGEMLWHLFVLVVGAKGVCFNTIVKFHLKIEICLCVINILAFVFGLTDKELVFLADEREDMFGGGIINRLSLGYPAATDFATHIFYMLLDYWIIKKGKLKIMDICFYFFVIFLSVYYCDARQASACILLIVLSSIYLFYRGKSSKPINCIVAPFLILGIPLFLFLSLYATLSYDESDIYWIGVDIILSHRLQYGFDAIQEFGIDWFGKIVEMYGSGKAGGLNEYNYVDNAYIQFLLRWGILIMGIIMLAFVKICRDAYNRKDFVILFATIIAGISSVITQYLFFINYCVLILALLSIHNQAYDKRGVV